MPPPATLKPARRQPIRASAYGIESAIEHGLRAIARLESRVLALGFSELGDIELPPDDLDQASLEAAAALYLASDLEEAGLIPAVRSSRGSSPAAR